MHHGTCMMHVPWCMSESLTRGGGENVSGIRGTCATRTFTYLARGPLQTSVVCPIQIMGFCILCALCRGTASLVLSIRCQTSISWTKYHVLCLEILYTYFVICYVKNLNITLSGNYVCQLAKCINCDGLCIGQIQQGKYEGFKSCDQPSNLVKIRSKWSIFQDLWHWNLTDGLKKG